MEKLRQFLRKHFLRLARKGKWSFFWRTWLEAVVLASVAASAVQAVLPAGPRSDLSSLAPWNLLALTLVVGPLIETIAFQCLPIEFTRAMTIRRSLRVVISVVPFAVAHRFAGLPTVVAAGIIGGLYFAFTYERWRKESLFAAVLMTFLVHSSFNLVGVLGMLFLPK